MKLPFGSSEGRAASAQRGKAFMYSLGLAGVVIAAILLYIGYNAPKQIPGRSYYNLKAEFADADNLTSSYQVRIGGRLVGQVLDPKVENGKAVVQLQLNPDIEPLRSDSTLRVRPRSPVGVRFVELIPGTKGKPLGNWDRLPASQTSETVQLDQALETFDPARREKAKTFLNEMGKGLLARGEDNNESLQRSPRFLSGLTEIAGAVNDRGGAPQRFIAGAQGAANAADPVRSAIADGFDPESRALDIFVNNADALREDLDVAPGTLASTRANLAQTDPALVELRGMATEMRPMLRASVPALRETATLLDESRDGLRDVPATMKLLDRSVPPTLRLLRTVKPVLPNMETAFRSSGPILDTLGPRECDINLFAGNWSSMLGYGTDAGTILRLNVVQGGEENVGGGAKGSALKSIRSNPYPNPCTVGDDRHEPLKGTGR